MEIRQRTELRRLLVPALRQSLKILTLPLTDLRAVVDQELESNPLLEEVQASETLPQKSEAEKLEEYLEPSSPTQDGLQGADSEAGLSLITKKVSLQDILLRQLGMFADTDEQLSIGQEIIGNIDEDGYLKADLAEMAFRLNVEFAAVEVVLKLIQQFEPAGVAGRSVSECLLIQLDLAQEKDPIIKKIVEFHLEDIAKKNYSHIAKALKEPIEKIEPLISKICKLDPKPGRDYSLDEAYCITPDITIDEIGDDLKIIVNNENIPTLRINREYRQMLKKDDLDPATREFLSNKLQNAMELLRAIIKRGDTLKRVIEVIVQIQKEAIKEDLSQLKPLTFKEVAKKIDVHESTVCRVVMNKYVRTPQGVVALKKFFSSHVHNHDGQSVSSAQVKGLIKDLIEQEDHKHPLSDEEIMGNLNKKHGFKLARRTVAKYR
ncbi:MAG: RNA polymerase factor sigma-54, partial [Candidatus Omnitrophota bacterium]|nr:RNA polymerase factor sigma-54 [Candidatus Omnitrophota bacterium]